MLFFAAKEYCAVVIFVNQRIFTIIGGMPRAGSRQFADILNASGQFNIFGEVYRSSFLALGDLFKVADREHSGTWSEKNYLRRRWDTVAACLCGISKGSQWRDDVTFLGIKTPRIEAHYDVIDRLFLSNGASVQFFYCCRNLIENYCSMHSNFGTTPSAYKRILSKSIEGLKIIQLDPRIKTNFLSLDSFVAEENKARWLLDRIFKNYFSLNVSEKQCADWLSMTSNRNSTEAVGRKKKEIDAHTLRILSGSEDLRDIAKYISDQLAHQNSLEGQIQEFEKTE